eukprot:10662331-Lingulodinium_polyedra.AAC.1
MCIRDRLCKHLETICKQDLKWRARRRTRARRAAETHRDTGKHRQTQTNAGQRHNTDKSPRGQSHTNADTDTSMSVASLDHGASSRQR